MVFSRSQGYQGVEDLVLIEALSDHPNAHSVQARGVMPYSIQDIDEVCRDLVVAAHINPAQSAN